MLSGYRLSMITSSFRQIRAISSVPHSVILCRTTIAAFSPCLSIIV
jgi:hypothetical protein